ncbi:hypothetical protein AX17_007199 [Amanita inopinata Kibby_2008]|nr:hypothetical protein AX17_007199 [Amanita inopinata Kibby_2008]
MSSPPTSAPLTSVLPNSAHQLPLPVSSAPPQPLPDTPKPKILLIGAAAFAHACKLPGSSSFSLSLASLQGHSGTVSDALDLSGIPTEYHGYGDMFSKAKAQTLALHRPYDLKIELEEGAAPPPTRIYSVSKSKLQALREFINKHLSLGFIRPSSSPHGAPVLFVKKKDGSLRLCVDYHSLNKISRKDRYPLPLISNLLNSPRKACLYTKIDLRHAYHLVHINKGDEWKTTFRTHYGSFEWLIMPFSLSNAS